MKIRSFVAPALSMLILFNLGCEKHPIELPTIYTNVKHTGFDHLSEARSFLARAAARNKIVFAGGRTETGSDAVDIYDISSGTWDTARLSVPRASIVGAGAGTKIVFAGNFFTPEGTADIYDVVTGKWNTIKLSEARMGEAAAGAGDKILIAGGQKEKGYSKVVDIYDVKTGKWSTAQLSEARTGLVGAGAANKILFAGGENETGASRTVDIYDVISGKWTTSLLSEASPQVAAGAGPKILFAGGGATRDAVDIYDIIANTWAKTRLSIGRSNMAAAATANMIMIAGGTVPLPPGDVSFVPVADIYNVATNKWSTLQSVVGKGGIAGAGAGNKILFAGGFSAVLESSVDVFTLYK